MIVKIMVRRHYLVSGRVQGVGFRYFTEKQANTLGLKGAVRNLEDGRVEIIAEGSAETLAAFEEQIATGPANAKVIALEMKDVSTGWMQEVGKSGFSFLANGREP